MWSEPPCCERCGRELFVMHGFSGCYSCNPPPPARKHTKKEIIESKDKQIELLKSDIKALREALSRYMP